MKQSPHRHGQPSSPCEHSNCTVSEMMTDKHKSLDVGGKGVEVVTNHSDDSQQLD